MLFGILSLLLMQKGLLKFSHLGLKGSATAAYHASFKEQEPQISLQLVHETKSVHI